MLRRNLIMFFAIGLFSTVLVAGQDTPADVRDLIGSKAAGGETQLQNRGYEFISTTTGTDSKYSYWWNNRKKACISVRTLEGRYDAILSTLPADCNKGTSNSGADSDSGAPSDVSDLVGARAAGGETQLKARGYSFVKIQKGDDRSYANWWHSRRKVCLNVVILEGHYDTIMTTPSGDCNRDSNGRPITNGGGDSAGSSEKVNVNDLTGARASSGESELQGRGFVNVQTYKIRANVITIWWRSESTQCLQVVTSNGKYTSLVPLRSHALCK